MTPSATVSVSPTTAALGQRQARFDLDNCSERQRLWVHSLGALLSTQPRTFEDLLAGKVALTARHDGTVATIRPNPL